MAVALVASGSPLAAESPAPFPEFEAKRVKPPKAGTRKRITVQIEPQAPAPIPAAAAALAPNAPVATPTGRYAWFWDEVSPALAAKSPGRLESALQFLGKPPAGKGVAAPRLDDMRRIVEAQGIEILKATVGTEVSPALVLAVMAVESGGRVDAVSGAGAQGLMQLMPATAERFGVSDSLDGPQNIRGGVAFLELLLQKFDRDPILVLAGYNAGENAVGNHDGVPPYAETRDYVPKVLAAYGVARALCVTPPEILSDGCVFQFR
nr:lytic transglycosylase domain-containing protein [Mesobacterium pallidum]